MKFSLIIALCALTTIQIFAQKQTGTAKTLNKEHIEKHTYHFNINNGDFENADVLLKALSEAHFVTLGELHNRTQLGTLTTALLRQLHDVGFEHMALEVGPYSAQKLNQLAKNGMAEVTQFYKTNASKLFGYYPIPFFIGQTDLQFLEEANSLGYQFWGIDQEFRYSFKYLINELDAFSKDSGSSEQQRISRKLKTKLNGWFRRAKIFRSFDMSCRLKEDATFQSYLKSFEETNDPDVITIIEAIHATLDIYCLAEQGKASSRQRIAYFKQNFNQQYKATDEAKVFLKIGSIHGGREKSPFGLYDIGHHISELADAMNKKSVHIRYLNRFYEGKDMIGKKGWSSRQIFMEVGQRDQWALIDLRTLRQQMQKNQFKGSTTEELEIMNYDFILIAPDDDKVKKHY